MYFYCDCSLERLKRGHSGSPQEPFSHKTCTRGFQPVLPSARLSASVAQRRAFSQCTAMPPTQSKPMRWAGTDQNQAPPFNFQQPTCVQIPEDQACHRNKGRG